MTSKYKLVPVGFCEDTALSLAERIFSTEVDEQLAEDIIQYARRLHDMYTAPQPAPEVANLVEALQAISRNELDAQRAQHIAAVALAYHRQQGGE
jgi:transposase